MVNKKGYGNIIRSLIVFAGLFLFLHPIHAATQKGSIQINLNRISKEHEMIQLSLYDVTDVVEELTQRASIGESDHISEEVIQQLEQEVKQRHQTAFTHTSDENQIVSWSELSKGAYLIVQQNTASYGKMEPLLICLPMVSSDTRKEQMNLVIEPAIIRADTPSFRIAAESFAYIPSEKITITDVLLLFCMFSLMILILSLWRYQREQREI